jgi:DNA-binding protein HU-beta
VNKAELIDSVRESTGIERRQVESAINETLDSVVTAIKAGERVSLFGFGTFNPSSRAARTGRNPQTGAPVKIAASRGVRFAPAAAFKAALNPKTGAKKASGAKKAAKASGAKKATTKKAAPAKKAATAKKAAKSTKKR